TPEKLAAAREIWAPRFEHLPRPLIAVLVGGSNGRYRLGQAEGVALARDLTGIVSRQKVGVMVTPSRRTPPEVQDTLKRA
ncbi:ELM1/GtrOC1 family putative glycosyltransferase, partial [Escherichia coli]|uniref:ELM1/GtrOC1 family putative glycosyltransferase n=1 Tax=Escherichia coli TaxID=562 RepID=UPI003CF6576B